MTKKLSFLALFVAAAMLCAAPALSVKNAFLPDAGIALSMNVDSFNKSFLGELVNHDALKEVVKLADFEFDPNDPTQMMLKSLLEKSTITMVTAVSPNEAGNVTDNPELALKKTMVCIQLPQPLGPMVDAVVAGLTNIKKEGCTVAPNVINECKGVLVKDEDGTQLAMNFSADGKYAFIGAPELLKKQLTDAAAAAAPAKLVATNVSGLPGAFVSLSILVTEDLKAAISAESPEAAAFASTVETFNLSAAPAGGDAVNLKLAGNFITPEIAGAVKSMADEYVPQAKAMAPALANGQEVPFLDTLNAVLDGNAVSLSCTLTPKDIEVIGQVAKAFMSANDDDDADDDDDDDDDGVEVEEL